MKKFFKALKKYWLSWLLLGLLMVLFSYLAMGAFKEWFSLKKGINEKEGQIQEVVERTETLSNEFEEIINPAYLEREARDKLNLKGEGEEIFVVIGLENIKKEENFDEVLAGLVDSALLKNGGVEKGSETWLNIKSWWNYFFNP